MKRDFSTLRINTFYKVRYFINWEKIEFKEFTRKQKFLWKTLPSRFFSLSRIVRRILAKRCDYNVFSNSLKRKNLWKLLKYLFFFPHSFIDWIFIILQRINRVKIEFKKKIIRNYNRWCAYNRIKRKEGKEIFVIIIIITATFYRSKNRFGWEKHATACLWKCRISIERLRKLD